jgi:hypothetical protein
METIYNTTKPFNFEELSLDHPTGLQGGSYFTKISCLGNNLYIQTGQGETKSGITKTNKKAYCDLMFPTSDETTIRWFEELEKTCIDYIYEKRSTWFHNDLERDDIETNFVSPLRLYKSGKYYLIRVYLANNSLENNLFKCYDDNSHPVPYDVLLQDNVKVIPLLEIQGIRFTSRNFSVDIGLKQIMVLEKPDFLQKCFIKKDLGKSEIITQVNAPHVDAPHVDAPHVDVPHVDAPHVDAPHVDAPHVDMLTVLPPTPLVKHIVDVSIEKTSLPAEQSLEEHDIKYNSLAKENESVTLKDPEEVYYDIWYEARKRAKQARDEAIKAYLEAKKIKATYMLDDYSDSDDEFDEYVADE